MQLPIQYFSEKLYSNTTTTYTSSYNFNLLSERRRKNAIASANFRERRKIKEQSMKIQYDFLVRKVQELQSYVIELEEKYEKEKKENASFKHNLEDKVRKVIGK